MNRLYILLLLAIAIQFINSATCFAQIFHYHSVMKADTIVFKIDSNSVAEYKAYTKLFFIGSEDIVGKNKSVSGKITWIKINSSVQFNALIVIDAAKFESGDETRDEDIREILEVNRYPQIVFKLSNIEDFDTRIINEEGKILEEQNFIAVGTLCVHGISKEIRFPISMSLQKNQIIVEGAAQIRFTDFNIEPPTFGWIVSRASDELTIKARISAVRIK
ncbi:MAG: YceI family protein [Ignavibacteria bacterium]|nr:YceI family protein [Ignavibacteria bacterium]